MGKRRVGVTARSRQNVGSQATGAPQFVTEMAAPLELRTPAGTCGKGRKPSADGSMATMAQKTKGAGDDPREEGPTAMHEASLPSPPTQWFCVAATRQGLPWRLAGARP